VYFNDGGVATGYFAYDADANVFTDWDVATHGGNTSVFFPFEFKPPTVLQGDLL
jgi:hypothetical protein